MNYEIGDSIKFNKKSFEKQSRRGFIIRKIEVPNQNKCIGKFSFIILEENGVISNINNTGIHLFSENLFKRSKALLCEKKIKNIEKEQSDTYKSMLFNILLGLQNKDV